MKAMGDPAGPKQRCCAVLPDQSWKKEGPFGGWVLGFCMSKMFGVPLTSTVLSTRTSLQLLW